ncbi:MAG: ribonuclease HI [Candidatus Margulisbacteria bacterium]|nr:ribonuclease HI [Candidatus Margulisiibacteriota bacterium]
MKHVIIYTDGACSGNPGPGGWGAILRYKDGDKEFEKEINGAEPETTNNKMELTAVIKALEALKEKCKIDLYTDSKYVAQGIEEWLPNWEKNGWRNANKKPVKNQELWRRLKELKDQHKVTFHWVKGHADNPYNNRCDELAVLAIDEIRKN